MVGALPDIPRLVLIGAPHSSNWDGVWGFAAKIALGRRHPRARQGLAVPDARWSATCSSASGVMPVDRKAAQGVVEQAAAMIRGSDRFWYGLAPEGTRKRVERWKTGFWKIARAADVPILRMYFHYPDRSSASARCSIRPPTWRPTWPRSASGTGRGRARTAAPM